MNEEERAQLEKAAIEADRLIREGKNAEHNGFMSIAAGLWLAKEYKTYRLHNMTFGQYISQADVSIKHGMAYALIHVYKEYGDKDVKGIGVARLIQLSNMKIEDKDAALDAARLLTSKDFKMWVREKKGLPTSDTCKHEGRKITICENCKARIG